MTSRVTEIIVDSHDPLSLAQWWAEVLDYAVSTPHADGWVGIRPAGERPSAAANRGGAQVPTIVFVPVPEEKVVKNRVHWDVWSIDRTQEEEVALLLRQGARKVDIGQVDVSWVVMADPEGNEFCVLA